MASVNPRIKWRGTTTERMSTVGPAGVIGYDTTLKMLCVFDGTTPGGILLIDQFLGQLSSNLTNAQKNTISRKINAVPVGAEMSWGSDTIPYGWLVKDGLTTYDTNINPELIPLYNWLNTNGYISCIIDSTHFKTPDDRNLVHRGKGSLTDDFFTPQEDAAPNITGSFGSWTRDVMNYNAYGTGAFTAVDLGNAPAVDNTGSEPFKGFTFDASHSSDVYGRDSTTEVRVKSIARHFIIKW